MTAVATPLVIRCPLCGLDVDMLVGSRGCASCVGFRPEAIDPRRPGLVAAIQLVAARRADIPALGGGPLSMVRTFADGILAELHALMSPPAKTGGAP